MTLEGGRKDGNIIPWGLPLLRSLARVVTTIPFKNPDEGAPDANDTVHGLAAGIWTNDLTKAHRLIPQLRDQTVCIGLWSPGGTWHRHLPGPRSDGAARR